MVHNENETILKKKINTIIEEMANTYGLSFNRLKHLHTKLLDLGNEWTCPSCGITRVVGYDDIAEVGIPICPECDTLMER